MSSVSIGFVGICSPSVVQHSKRRICADRPGIRGHGRRRLTIVAVNNGEFDPYGKKYVNGGSSEGGNGDEPKTDSAESEVDEALDTVEDVADDVQSNMEDAVDSVQEGADDVVESGQEEAEVLATELQEGVQDVQDTVEEKADEVAEQGEKVYIDAKMRNESPEELKRDLFIAVAGTNRGFAATKKQSDAIFAIASTLEKCYEEPNPNDDPALLGKWRLIYTNALDVLVLGALPLVQLGQVYQNIVTVDDGSTLKIENICSLEPSIAPVLNRLSGRSVVDVIVSADAERSGSSRLNISFKSQKFIPKTLLGRNVYDILPPLKINMKSLASGYIETTYLDDEIRISRSFGDNYFILTREE